MREKENKKGGEREKKMRENRNGERGKRDRLIERKKGFFLRLKGNHLR